MQHQFSGLVAASALFGFAAWVSWAATPDSGTLTTSSGDLTYTAGPFVVANPTPQLGAAGEPPVCEDDGQSCDKFALTVDLPAGYQGQVAVSIGWPDAAADFDVYVYDAERKVVGQAAGSADPEVAVFPAKGGSNVYSVEVIPFAPLGQSIEGKISLIPATGGGGGGGGGVDFCEASGQANTGSARLSPAMDRAFKTLPAMAPFAAYLHFSMGSPAERRAVIERLGLNYILSFENYVPAVFVSGTLEAFRAAVTEPSVSYIEANEQVRYMGETQSWSTRVRVAQEAVSGGPYYDSQGRVLLGDGVTVSIHDSGLNALQGDFEGRLLANFKAVGDPIATQMVEWVDVGYTNTDTTSGHGSHVVGTVGGSGLNSTGPYPVAGAAPTITGTFTGAAPKAGLLMHGVGEVLEPAGVAPVAALIYIDASIKHLLDTYDDYEPRVRVASFSLGNGAGTPYDPAAVRACLSKDLVAKGVSMVWAAGNSAGDGTADATSGFCKDPTPGVICVASVDDATSGKTSPGLSSFSSRGEKGKPETYPDIAAPGSNITSTCIQGVQGQITCTTGAETRWQPGYGTISGTSMATPHVSGALALIYQARPELTPAQVEELIQKTARKVGPDYEPDPENPGSTINFAYGAGLLNLPAALDALGVAKAGLPNASAEQVILDGDEDATAPDLAGDVVKMTMQEGADAQAGPGVTFRLTVADATDFIVASSIVYTVQMNVGGNPFESSVIGDPDGMSIPEAGARNSAVASSVARDGNVISFFVPYSQMGFPALYEPIHNIRVFVTDSEGVVEDRAPSPDYGNLAEDLFPQYGRPFTVQLLALAPTSNEKTCELPGVTRVTSPPGGTALGSNLPTGEDDLRQVWVAEPSDMPGKLVLTMKVTSLATPPPNYRWYVYFKVPGAENRYFAAMDTLQGLPQFIYGELPPPLSTPAAEFGQFTVLGDLDAASNYSADGFITLVVDKASLPVPITNGMELGSLTGSIRQTSNPENGVGLTVDSAAGTETYTVVGNACIATAVVQASTVVSGSKDGGRFGGALGLLLLPLLGFAVLRQRR